MILRCVALCMLLWGFPAAAQETVTLRWQFPQGEPVEYLFDQERSLEIQRPDAEPAKQRRSRKTAFALTGLQAEDADSLRLEVRLLRLRERVVRGKDDRQLDSGTVESEGNWPQARQLLQPMQVRLSERGAPFVLERFGEKLMDNLPAAERAHWESALGDGIVRTLAFSLLGAFPERPIRVGAVWEAETVLEIPGFEPLTFKITNTLMKLRGQGEALIAEIHQEGRSGQELARLGLEEWSQSGEILFDVVRGQIKSTKFASRLITNKDDGVVQIDTVHRLVRADASEGDPGQEGR